MKLVRISSMWCTSCIVTYPIWKEIQETYPNIEYEELDYDLDDVKEQVGDILPVVILKDQDQEITRIVGEKTKKEILEILEKFI